MSAPLFESHAVRVTPWAVEASGATTDVRSIVSVRAIANRGNRGLLALGLLILSAALPWTGCAVLCLGGPGESEGTLAALTFVLLGLIATAAGLVAFPRREVWIVAGGTERLVLSVGREQEPVTATLVQAIQHAMLNAQR